MPANPIAVDVVVLPTAPIGVTLTNPTIVVATTVNLGNTIAVAASEYASGPPGVGVPPGGSPGQYLLKNTATDYDTGWTTAGGGPPTGAVPANDLSGGGSSYPSPTIQKIKGAAVGTTTPLARGDLLVADATPALSRLAKGTPGFVLTATATDVVWQVAAATITMQGNVVPTGTRPGTTFTLPITPTVMMASLNGLILQKVGSPAANDEYSQTGASMTTFYTVTAADKLVVWLWA
jgi:hypothetical protein